MLSVSRTARDLAYLALALVTSVVAFVVAVTGLSVSLSLACFIVGLPVILVTAWAFRRTADLGRLSVAVAGRRPPLGRYADHGGERFLARLGATLRDPQTWRDLAWLLAHSCVGFGYGVAAVCIVGVVIGIAVMPAWYWTVRDGVDFAIWRIDTLGEAFAAVPLAIPLAVAGAWLVRLMAASHVAMTEALLGSPAGAGAARPQGGGELVRALARGAHLVPHALGGALAGVVCTLIWALTGGAFWPGWVWLGLAASVAAHALAVRAARAAGDRRAVLRVEAEAAVAVVLVCVAVWALAGGGYLWPAWPALGLGVALALHALVAFRDRLPWWRDRRLAERVDVLTRSRRGVLDVQAAELRRIERDLHDGAQARLVALSMELGRAEERLAGQPEVVEILRRARSEAGAAIAELRDLARGIAPPVLADRGLVAAVEALGRRVAMPVEVSADLEGRAPGVVETAAYFVVAESLTNVAKHAPDAHARVRITARDGRLVVEVADDGGGGADPAGRGLTGLRQRVEALDGTLTVTSPPGQGTTIRAELPCAS